MKYYFGGVNGVGKSTLIDKIVELEPNFEHFRGATELMKHLGIEGDYDALRSLNHEESTAAFFEIVEARLSEPGDVIFDAHFANLKHGQLYTITSHMLGKLDGLVLITTPLETIFKRLRQDNSKDRSLFVRGSTDMQQRETMARFVDLSTSIFEQAAQQYQLPSVEIANTSLIQAAQEFLLFDRKLHS
jgi:adenylate kinase